MSNKNASIKLKLEKARNLLAEVDVLMQLQFYNAAINRLYYSCYHATKALPLTKDLVPKTHSGVASNLHQHFVQNGTFDFEQASFFSRLMKEREQDDYNDFMIVDGVEIKEFIEPAKAYIAYLGKLIEQYFEQLENK